jgi:hypothetical protein
MTDFIATTERFVLLTELCQIVEVDAGQEFTSNQVCEIFDTYEQAHTRALALGCQIEPPDA